MFRNLETTDEARKTDELKKIAKNIGCISVSVYDWKTTGETFGAGVDEPMKARQSIPEKALKGQPIDMSAGLRAAKPIPTQRVLEGARVGSANAEVTYKYRSRASLQMLDIIPGTPEPQPLEERDPNSLNLTEARRLLAQYQEQGLTSKKVKMEEAIIKKEDASQRSSALGKRRSADADDEDDGFEVVETKKAKKHPAKVEVIDLTGFD